MNTQSWGKLRFMRYATHSRHAWQAGLRKKGNVNSSAQRWASLLMGSGV